MDLHEDVAIGAVGERELVADLYRPAPEHSLRTAVVHLHGGGWRAGSRKRIRPRSEALAQRGFTVVAAEYRLLDEAPWPAQLHDVKSAIRWTRSHAEELDIEASRIALVGHSAGGHLSLVAAGSAGRTDLEGDGPELGVDSSVAAVVAFYPTVWFSAADAPNDGASGAPRPSDGTSPSWMLLGDGASAAAIAAATPSTYFTAHYPPTCIFHGGDDTLVGVTSSVRLRDALDERGVENELHLVSRQGHEFDASGPYLELVAEEVAMFLRKTVSEVKELAEQFARMPVRPARA